MYLSEYAGTWHWFKYDPKLTIFYDYWVEWMSNCEWVKVSELVSTSVSMQLVECVNDWTDERVTCIMWQITAYLLWFWQIFKLQHFYGSGSKVIYSPKWKQEAVTITRIFRTPQPRKPYNFSLLIKLVSKWLNYPINVWLNEEIMKWLNKEMMKWLNEEISDLIGIRVRNKICFQWQIINFYDTIYPDPYYSGTV